MFWIEIAATLFGFACVVLTIRRNIWCWPVGLVQVVLFIVVFYDARLYSDLILHVIYVGMQIYGWYCWQSRPTEAGDGSLVVSTLGRGAAASWIATTVCGTLLLGYLMHGWTDAAVPYGDAFTTVASLAAQYLLAQKKLENWILWIVVDIVAVAIYLHKDLLPTAVLYSLFLVLAATGFFVWRARLFEQRALAEVAT